MLMASGTVDKDSIYLRTNTALRTHHRTMMATLSKLILSSHACVYNPMDNINKMLSDSNELLMAARNFISTGEAIPIPVQHIEPQLQLHKPSTIVTFNPSSPLLSTLSSSSSKAKQPHHILDANLAETIEIHGDSLNECIDGMISSITAYKQRIQCQAAPSISTDQKNPTMDSSRSSLSALLFTQFRNFSNQSGQYLAIFDTIDFTGFQSPEVVELDYLRQKIYQGVGDLLYKLQVLTDEDVPLDGTVGILVQDGNEIKSTISGICNCVDALAFDPSLRQQQTGGNDIPEAFMFGATDSPQPSVGDSSSISVSISNYSSNHSSNSINDDTSNTTMDLQVKRDSAQESSKTRTSFSSSHRYSTPSLMTPGTQDGLSSIQRLSTTSPDHARQSNAKLKKFFGDDVPEQITPKSPSLADQASATVAGGPPNVAMELAAGSDPKKEEERPWYLQYDYKPNEIVFNMEGSVKGGTLRALVVRLTLHDYSDMNFINTFLLTYRSFCSSMELLTLLEQRYTRPPPEGLTDQELDIWMNKKLKVIRLRVFNVLKNWLEQYYNEDDHVILDELLQFTTTEIRSTLRFSAEQLERLIRKRLEATGDGLKKMVLTLHTAPPVPILPRNRKKFRLLDIDPLELARQLTIMDFKLYSLIRPVECLNKVWSKEAVWTDGHLHQHVPAANIRASIEYCNQVTSWVSGAILSQLEVKKRVTLIKHWVQIAERCRQLNNFNTCMAILSAFDNSAVGRLKRTWEMVGARTNQTLSQIRKLLNANRNFMEYRAIIHSVNPPCIPFLGIYLQDLTFIEDGNSDFLKTSKDLINFAKRAKTAEVIREIQQYQSTHYQLTPVDEIQVFIQNNLQSTRDEEQLYNESLKLEPREREDEKITRLLQESGFL
ncbi:ras guanine nucleotide exchange factor domain-containing protein [Chlamydoabsidia padenii]|nr:ras guanine nucleotide exchange factor domain-containing protein [Chlamydoabsidia padenii]